MPQKAQANPEALKWARQTVGLSLTDAVNRAKIKAKGDTTAEQRLESWENGEDQPTWRQASDLASAYKRPVLTFFIKKLPTEQPSLPDFRTIKDESLRQKSPEFQALIRATRYRQEMLADLVAENEDEQPELTFMGKWTPHSQVKMVSEDIRKTLKFSFEDQQATKSPDALFGVMRTKCEEVGIFVQLTGDLGSHHSRINTEEFRGFVLGHDIAPMIVINSNDAKAARLFTLIHELAHIWIGEEGVSNTFPYNTDIPENQVEKFCNTVAGEFLMPEEYFIREAVRLRRENLMEWLQELSRIFKVSRAAAGMGLFKHKLIDREQWFEVYQRLEEDWRLIKQKQKDTEGGPTRIMMTKFKFGERLVRLTLSALNEGTINHLAASKILDLKPQSFDKLRREVYG